jgi:ABC-type uncharacterized transport system permease subunit
MVVADFFINWFAALPAYAVPYALAALGLIITEKSGVLSLGAEGFLLMGAMAGAGSVISLGGYPFVALIVSATSAALLSLVFAVMVVTLRVNQVVAGLTIVFLGSGLTSLVADENGWRNHPLNGLQPLYFGGLSKLPMVGHVVFGQDALVYITILIFALVSAILSRTTLGLKLRAVGDGPEAADAAGISISSFRYGAIALGSAMVGLAGGYLSLGVAKIWVDGMSGGRGWIAIALVVFARWRPWRGFFGALLFGGLEAIIPRIAAVGIKLPQYFVLMSPYLATLLVMILMALRRGEQFDQPNALGEPHIREERR